jgi:hypothetical protein
MKSPNSPVALIVSHQAEKSGESRWFHDRAIEYCDHVRSQAHVDQSQWHRLTRFRNSSMRVHSFSIIDEIISSNPRILRLENKGFMAPTDQ